MYLLYGGVYNLGVLDIVAGCPSNKSPTSWGLYCFKLPYDIGVPGGGSIISLFDCREDLFLYVEDRRSLCLNRCRGACRFHDLSERGPCIFFERLHPWAEPRLSL